LRILQEICVIIFVFLYFRIITLIEEVNCTISWVFWWSPCGQ